MDLDTYHKLLKFTPSDRAPAPPYGEELIDTKNKIDLEYVQNVYYEDAPPKKGGGDAPVLVISLF